jgi:universal stress protein E
VSWAHPALGEILAQIAELGPDLVVKDLRSKSGQALPTALDRHLLGLCPPPLLLVHDAAPALPRRILVAIDPGRADPDSADFNEAILRVATGMALQSDAELHLMHAMTPLTAMATYPGECVFSAELYDSFVASQRDLFGRYADAHGVPQERRQFVTGPAASAITEAAQRLAADLIVIGSVRRHGIDRLLIGSTTEAVLDQLPCSLLTVRPEAANSAPRVLRQVNARQTRGS